jgi:uncharacterized protein
MTPQEQLAKQVESLEELAQLDAEIRRLDAQLSEEQGQLEGLKVERARLEAKLAVERASVDEMQKTMNELIAEARQMGQQIERSREKLSRARNERESMAAQRELEELRKLLRDREEEVGKLTALAEAAKRSIEETDEKRGKIATQLGDSESSRSASINAMSHDREAKLTTRAELARRVAPTTLRRYEAVRQKRGGTALARANASGTCSACHMALPPQLFQRLRRRESLDQCPHCARILYYWVPGPAPEGGG